MKKFTIRNIEYLTLTAYIILTGFVMLHHEPWFDEAQAWLIARDNSLGAILWKVLRYEGHPPLWYLLLYIPAHLDVPFELGLKLVNLFFAGAGAALLIRRSPFPLVIRLFLPFTYFLFYQYGVISRSYSVLALILWLTAIYFPVRNTKPFAFSILLALLGGITAHGILIAFGISLAWLWEMAAEKHSCPKCKRLSFVKDRRFLSLFIPGIACMFYVLLLWPMPDKLTPLQSSGFNMLQSLLKFIILPVNGISFELSYSYNLAGLLAVTFSGLIFTIFYFLQTLHSKVWMYILLPYMLVSGFMSTIYFSAHHSGIYTLLLIYSCWLYFLGEKASVPFLKKLRLLQLLKKLTGQESRQYRPAFTAVLALVFVIQLYWSVTAAINDIRLPYAASRELAAFIKANNMKDSKIYNCYLVWDKKVSYSSQNVETLAYFDRNIFYNHNFGREDLSYSLHKTRNEKKVLRYLNQEGTPELIIRNEYSLEKYQGLGDLQNYTPVAIFNACYMWKDTLKNKYYTVYVKKSILTDYPGLKPLNGKLLQAAVKNQERVR